MPEMAARPGVERHEIAVANGAEDDVAGCGQDTVRVRTLKDLEVPDGLARFRIESLDSGGSAGFTWFRTDGCGSRRPADVLLAGFVAYRRTDVLLAVLGVREVHPSGLRAVGRRLEVGGTADRRIHGSCPRDSNSIPAPESAGQGVETRHPVDVRTAPDNSFPFVRSIT
jgi:hypothetical protein